MAQGLSSSREQSTRQVADDTPNLLIDLRENFESDMEPGQPAKDAVGSCHFALVVDDLPSAVKELESQGV